MASANQTMTRPITIHLLGVLLQLRLQGDRVLLQGRRFPCGSRRPICGTSRTKATTAPTSGGRTEVCRKRPFTTPADRRRPRLDGGRQSCIDEPARGTYVSPRSRARPSVPANSGSAALMNPHTKSLVSVPTAVNSGLRRLNQFQKNGSSQRSVQFWSVSMANKSSIVSDLHGWRTPSVSGEELQAPGKSGPQ